MADMDVQFYVYIYFDPITDIPFYVGKGQKYRSHKHLHQCHNRPMAMKIRALKAAGHTPRIEILPMRSEEDAFSMEETLVCAIGKRVDGSGPLFNMSDGGGRKTAGMTGKKHSAESRAKMSAAHKGKPKSDQFKEKMRIVGLARDVSHLHSEESLRRRKEATNTPEFRKKLSERAAQSLTIQRQMEMTEKARIKNTGTIRDSETRKRMSEAFKGRTHSDAAKRKMSESQRKRYARTDD